MGMKKMAVPSIEKKKSLIDWRRFWLHVPHGTGIAFFTLAHPVLGALFFGVVCLYQVLEECRIHDLSYKDVAGYAGGMPVGAALWYALAPWLTIAYNWYLSLIPVLGG